VVVERGHDAVARGKEAEAERWGSPATEEIVVWSLDDDDRWFPYIHSYYYGGSGYDHW
jgi:hypothetical protein